MRLQGEYSAKRCSLDYYNNSMSRITLAFQTLSKEVIELTRVFQKSDLLEASRILEELQRSEKEKLELTVKWQVMVEKERALGNGGLENPEGVECGGHCDRTQLRKR